MLTALRTYYRERDKLIESLKNKIDSNVKEQTIKTTFDIYLISELAIMIDENPLLDEVEWKRPTKKVDQNLNVINDNFEAKLPKSSSSGILENYTMIVGNPYSWIDASGGIELLLGCK